MNVNSFLQIQQFASFCVLFVISSIKKFVIFHSFVVGWPATYITHVRIYRQCALNQRDLRALDSPDEQKMRLCTYVFKTKNSPKYPYLKIENLVFKSKSSKVQISL